MLDDILFEINFFNKQIKSLADCKDVSTKITMKVKKENEFYKVLLKDNRANKYRNGTLCAKNVTEELRKQAVFSEENKLILHTERSNVFLLVVPLSVAID